jgi:hypothetical protein
MTLWQSILGDPLPAASMEAAPRALRDALIDVRRRLERSLDGYTSHDSYLRTLKALRRGRNAAGQIEATDEATQEVQRDLREIAAAIFCVEGMHPFIDQLVRDYLAACQQRLPDAELEEPGTWEWMKQCVDLLQHLPAELRGPRFRSKFHNTARALYTHEDPIRQGNIPYRLMDVRVRHIDESEREIQGLRFATPTIGGLATERVEEEELAPEFLAYVEDCAAKEIRHLYINLQHRKGNGESISEKNRVSLLENLQSRFPDTLTVVTLPKNSYFYRQKGRFKHRSAATEFMDAIFENLLSNEAGFFLPQRLVQDRRFDFEGDVRLMLQEMHLHYFEGRGLLNREERQNFIELFYIHLSEYLLCHLEIDRFNMSCKSSMDRGASVSSLFYLYGKLRQGLEFDGALAEKTLALLVGPALFVRNRGVLPHHAKRSLAAMRLLLIRGPSMHRFGVNALDREGELPQRRTCVLDELD